MVCVHSRFSHVRLFAIPWTVAHQAPRSSVFKDLCVFHFFKIYIMEDALNYRLPSLTAPELLRDIIKNTE